MQRSHFVRKTHESWRDLKFITSFYPRESQNVTLCDYDKTTDNVEAVQVEIILSIPSV